MQLNRTTLMEFKTPLLLAALGAVLILAALVGSCATSSSAAHKEAEEKVGFTQEAHDKEVISQLLTQVDEESLRHLIGDESADKLLESAQSNTDAAWIAANCHLYDADGIEVQVKLLKLAANEPAALSYVRSWPDSYPSDPQTAETYAASATGTSSVPLLFQWDKRWGYTVYCSTSFSLTGCCPTAYCMAYQDLTGKTDLSPADFAQAAQEDGYMDPYAGTFATFIVDDASRFGLTGKNIGTDSEALRNALISGGIVICNVGPGDFTDDGHFIVLTGYDDQGMLKVNDPYSAIRSSQSWDVETILAQTRALYALWG